MTCDRGKLQGLFSSCIVFQGNHKLKIFRQYVEQVTRSSTWET